MVFGCTVQAIAYLAAISRLMYITHLQNNDAAQPCIWYDCMAAQFVLCHLLQGCAKLRPLKGSVSLNLELPVYMSSFNPRRAL